MITLSENDPRRVVGSVTKTPDEDYLVDIAGAKNISCGEVWASRFFPTKQACWDYIARNYPGQIFYWKCLCFHWRWHRDKPFRQRLWQVIDYAIFLLS